MVAYQRSQDATTEAAIRGALSLDAIRWQYVHGVADTTLVQLALFRDYATNVALYPQVHEYFRTSQVPLLAVWGEGDEIFGPDGARAFSRDLPDAEVHLVPGGHFLLESAVHEVADLIRGFLGSRVTVW